MQNDLQHLLQLGMTQDREYEALKAYFRFLHMKGAHAEGLLKREQVLTKLDDFLSDIPSNGANYRAAVDQFLRKVNKTEWPFCLMVVREYFLFWIGDVKKIAQLNAQDGFEAEPMQWQALTGSLKGIWSILDKVVLGNQQTILLEKFQQQIEQQLIDLKLKTAKLKLARLLLFKLGNTQVKSPKIYRRAVDATLPIFETAEQQELFLNTVREFYYCWLVN